MKKCRRDGRPAAAIDRIAENQRGAVNARGPFVILPSRELGPDRLPEAKGRWTELTTDDRSQTTDPPLPPGAGPGKGTPPSSIVGRPSSALAGLRVVELGELVAAPFAARLLGDLGAEVLKVEPPEGDRARYEGPFPCDRPDRERSGLFLYVNANKRGVTLDPATESGRELLLRLLDAADVFLTNRPPAWLDAHGLAPATIAESHPHLVYTAVTPFGLTGPYRDHLACDLTICHGSGVASAIGDPDRAPLTLPEMVPSYFAALSAAGATMAAVLVQEACGLGQVVDISIAECLSTLLIGPAAVRGHFNQRARQRVGHRVPGYWPDTILPCKDGYVCLIAVEEDQWQRLVEVLGNPDWAADPLFQEKYARFTLADTLEALVEPWLRERTKRAIFQACQANRVPTAPVNSAADVANDPHLEARGFWWHTTHPAAGDLRLPGPFARFSATPMRLRRPAPRLGEHNDAVYCGQLGYSPAELVQLRATGAI